MSGTRKHRHLVLALGLATAATIAACDQSPTQPTALSRVNGKTLAIEGDTLQCAYGWVVANGAYVCKDPE